MKIALFYIINPMKMANRAESFHFECVFRQLIIYNKLMRRTAYKSPVGKIYFHAELIKAK